MEYKLKRPCKKCPFRNDLPENLRGWLGEDRTWEIMDSLLSGNGTFSCHATNEFDDETGEACKEGQHCAGALIMMEKLESPTQMMRIAERLRMYDRSKLDMDAPVFDDEYEFTDFHTKQEDEEQVKGELDRDKLLAIVREMQFTEELASVRYLAKRLKSKQQDVLDACEDLDLNVNVGFACGNGVADFDRIGDYTIEDLTVDYPE